MPQTDVLIIGSGIAGLSVAIKVATQFPHRQCIVITKQDSAESNTRYAQGGIAVVSDFAQDSFEDHIHDTLEAGDGLCNRAVVEHVVQQGPARLQELIDMGADFNRDASGGLMLGREGGHTANRIIHFQDITGLNISTALLNRARSLPNVSLLSHHVAIDLITEKQIPGKSDVTISCKGALVLNQETTTVEHYCASFTILATGGIGQLYRTTTNPVIATGDGIAMAHRAGARISNMEFIQFHPTALYDLRTAPAFLISEAVRGQGAYLRNTSGERFMLKYHVQGELACRDVVSRAIASEMVASRQPFVYLDCTHLEHEELLSHFTNIYRTCLSKGIDITRDYIPVTPAAHYLCGGIDVDIHSRTTIKNLYACGECSNTGLHGANRLASNSLLEAIVFAHNCFGHMRKMLEKICVPGKSFEPQAGLPSEHFSCAELSEKKIQLQTLMSKYAGIVRSTEGLEYAFNRLKVLEQEVVPADRNANFDVARNEVINMITCAQLVVKQSLERKENKGGFHNKNLKPEPAIS